MNPRTLESFAGVEAKINILGIDIGGTKIEICVASEDGEFLAWQRIPTKAQRGPEPILKEIILTATQLLEEANLKKDDLAGIGVSAPGPLNPEKGIIYQASNMPGWVNLPVRKILEDEFKRPTFLENDANASCMAEWKFGAGKGFKNLIFLTMSTGIGGGLILDGRLYRGANFFAGEVGHQYILADGPVCGCGKKGHLEALCSGSGITKRLKELVKQQKGRMWEMVSGDLEKLSPKILVEAAKEKDPLACYFLDQTINYLAYGLSNLIFILNPEAIILGTIVAKTENLIIRPLRERVKELCWDILTKNLKILPALLTERLGSYASLSVGLEGLANGKRESDK